MPAAPVRLALLTAALLLGHAAVSAVQFSSGVNAVEVYASVSDARGRPVRGLRQEDFVVREDGIQQQVSTFAAGEFPLAVAVCLDRSFSMAGKPLAAAKSAARLFLGELRASDESMVLAVGSSTEVIASLSADRGVQYAALEKLDAFGTTGLYDSIIAAIDAIRGARGRRALVLLSDGTDRYSAATDADVLARARASDALIYPVAFGRSRPPVFAELAAVSGGRSFHVADATRLPETLKAIADELRNQYLLGYTPTKPIAPGSNEWRAIRVTVNGPDVRVRARDGYVAR